MSTLKVAQLVRETGCLETEAETALEAHGGNLESSRESLRAALEFRRRKFGRDLEAIWKRYSAGTVTDYDGTLKLLEDLGVDPSDEVALALCYELGAQHQVFDKEHFIQGWARLKCVSLPEMRREVQALAAQLSKGSYFTRIYKNTYKFNLEPGHRLLDLETAVAYWELLLKPRYAGVDKWIAFMQQQKAPKVSSDTWNMYLEFLEYAKLDPELKGWDENASWPIIIDDYVEYLRNA